MEMDLWIAWPVSTEGVDTRSVLAAEYSDHGAWARHYSTVRMTIGTFFLTAATGIIYLRWDDPEPGTAILAGIVFATGALVFLRFTWLTFKEMNRQRKIVASYRTALGKQAEAPAPLPRLGKWDGIYLGVIFLILFAAFDLWWLYLKPAAAKAELKIPVAVQVGDAPAVTFKVPVKVTVSRP
jgi:hypothetical protein